MSKHRRSTADIRLDQPTQAVLGVALSERAAGVVLIRHGDGVTVVRDAMRCPESAHLLAVLAEVQAQRRSAAEQGYDVATIAYTWTPNIDARAQQLAEWLMTPNGPEVVVVEPADAAGAFRGEREFPRGTTPSLIDDRTSDVSQQDWSAGPNIATLDDATDRFDAASVMASGGQIDIDDSIVTVLDIRPPTVSSPAETELARARRAAEVAIRSNATERPRPPRGRTLLRAAAVTVSVASVMGILTAALLRAIVVSAPAPSAPPVDPDNNGHVGTGPPDNSPAATPPPGSSSSAIEVAQSTQAHYLQPPGSPAGSSTSASPTPPAAPSVPVPPQANQPVTDSPDMPIPANTDEPPPAPADASASQSTPPSASEQPVPTDATPPSPSVADSAPPATPPQRSAGDVEPPQTP